MWLLLGPFDGEQNDLSFTKTKLLKPDSKYLVGRKDAQILVRNKKISSEHGEFVVDSFSVEQAGTPGCRPTLTYNNFKKEWLTIRSSGREPQRNPQGQPIEVHSGDTLQIVNGITVQVLWNPICCYSGAAKAQLPVPPESCASLGVNYTFDPAKDVTHHLISSYAATPTIATSLVGSAQFVTPAWLQEVVRLGTLPLDCDPSSGVPLEVSFALPPVSKYRPSFSPTLPAAQKDYSVWEPNEARLKMFHKFRFLCVGEKPREVPLDVRNLISKGEGSIEVFEVHSGVTKFQKALKRGSVKEGKTLVVLGDEAILTAAVGKDVLNELVLEAGQMGLQFHPPDTLVQAAIEIDTSLLKSDPSAITQSEAFHVVEKTPERNTGSPPAPKSPRDSSPEHSPPIVPRRRVTTRVEPTKTAPEPPADSSDREGTPPIKVPMRRATARRATATEDRSSATPPRELTPPPAVIDDDTPMDFRRLPKRRAGTASVEATPAKRARSVGPSHIDDSLKEPPLKKFRALFDSTAPGEMESGAIQEESESQMFQETNFDDGFHSKMSTTQTETQTQSGRTQRRGGRAQTITSLSALREEEEEESMVLGTQQRKKRTLEDVNEDVEMEDATGPTSKRQATETNRVVSGGVGVGTNLPARASSRPPVSKTKPPSTATVSIKSPSKNKGAAVGKPDKDEAFLKALASTKRGKKREDEFDREFNRLKISKPDLDAQNGREPEEDWKVLADFGDDSGIRGNFMTICELEVFKEKNGRNAKSAGEMRPEWEGKPNFKKFKRKNVPRSGAKVELFVDNQKDGLGPSYWKDGDSSQPMTQSKPKPRARSKALAALDEEVSAPEEEVMEVEDSPPPVRKGRTRSGSKPPSTSRSKPPSRAGSATPAPTRSSRRGKAVASIPEDEEPLFLDDDSQSQSQSQFQSQSQTMGRRSGRGGRGSNRSETLDEEEEDDFETLDSAFDRKGTRGKPSSSKPPSKTTTTTRTRARKAPVVLLDDSDDDAVFKGF